MTKNQQIVECVPSFSEDRDIHVIRQIAGEIERVKGVRLLDVDPGEATNKAVMTSVGSPDSVLETVFQAVKEVAQLIDMRDHHEAHPRMSATDVCPLIPVASITLEECTELVQQLTERIAGELSVPYYYYEATARTPGRKNLAVCHAGEYETLPKKMNNPAKTPDSGARPSDEGVAHTGCTAVDVRDFLIAINFNLNTTSTRRANAVAFDVRERGRPRREGDSPVDKPMKDEHGKTIMIPGTLKGTKAIEWYINEHAITQVSTNIIDISAIPLHAAFDEACRYAQNRDIRVTETEVIGLIPRCTLIDVGKYLPRRQNHSTGIPEEDILTIAIKSLGLDDLKPFSPREEVIEYLLEDDSKEAKLIDPTVKKFVDEISRESPAPNGGTISVCMGALGATLGTMIVNLPSHKAEWDDRWEEFNNWADKGQGVRVELVHLADEDAEAFNHIMAAFGLSKKTDEDKTVYSAVTQEAALYAIQVPLHTMKTAYEAFGPRKATAQKGSPNSVSDAGMGVLAARTVVLGTGLGVKINASGLRNREVADQSVGEVNQPTDKANQAEVGIMRVVGSKLQDPKDKENDARGVHGGHSGRCS